MCGRALDVVTSGRPLFPSLELAQRSACCGVTAAPCRVSLAHSLVCRSSNCSRTHTHDRRPPSGHRIQQSWTAAAAVTDGRPTDSTALVRLTVRRVVSIRHGRGPQHSDRECQQHGAGDAVRTTGVRVHRHAGAHSEEEGAEKNQTVRQTDHTERRGAAARRHTAMRAQAAVRAQRATSHSHLRHDAPRSAHHCRADPAALSSCSVW